ncbi:hypothetical protein [Mycolicibacterium llatzerense]|uniref:hypothetical protein n=1 Tax=Mycolicibacterium llatzerense TaxID=280871 RepID=UPI0021B63B07|nr:hypothetical protein [Mycolicibacterium llatzerense]MCT7361320.1 hypothetical protein [Mycolicibacterium llatzerense]
MTADDLIANASDSLFAPESVQDVRKRLARIESAGCPCVESDHLNALHDLAHHDVPVLLGVIEAQAVENETLRGAIESIRQTINASLGKPLHHLVRDVVAAIERIETK